MLVDQHGGPLRKPEQVPEPKELLRESPTITYEPWAHHSGFVFSHNRPPFTLSTVQQMLTDPRVIYGLWLLKGPLLTNAHVFVQCLDENIRTYVIELINRFWMNSATRALKAIEWGYSASEVMYREVDGQVRFDTLKDFSPADCKLSVLRGKPNGIVVRNVKGFDNPVFLGFPKAFYHIHWRDRNPWFGLSRLHGAHIPWWETWSDGGFRDIRRLWFYKNSYEGGIMRHPPGNTKNELGVPIANKDAAREMINKKRTGGTLCLPNTPGSETGSFAWTYEPPVANAEPQGLLEYGDVLRDEILEALGIPPEVVKSSGDQGFGSSTGRQVPQMAFYSILQELFQWLLNDLMDFLINPLLDIVFGVGHADVLLQPFQLSEDLSSGGSAGDPGMEEGTGDFNGNQFEDENQRAVFMAHCVGRPDARHFRRNRKWWTITKGGVICPMSTAI